MKILFDQSGKPISQGRITERLNNFPTSYAKTVQDIINRSQNGMTQNIYFENVAQLMPSFLMTRKGPFNGIKYEQGIVQDPNGKISDTWSAIGINVAGLKNILLQQHHINRKRIISDTIDALRGSIISDLRKMFNMLLPICMGKATNGRVAASKILFAVLPEAALPVDTAMWNKLFNTIDYGDIITMMSTEIMAWENQTGIKLDTCDSSGNLTLPAIYNVMAMKARP